LPVLQEAQIARGRLFENIFKAVTKESSMSRLYYPKPTMGKMASGAGGGVDLGDVTKKVAKLIPTELVTAYAALVSASAAVHWPSFRGPAVWACFVICWILTPFYLNHVADPGKPKRNQIIFGTLAFPIWAYLVSGSQVAPDYYDASLGTILALVFSLITSLIPMNR
jgi:hypothetical protein